MKKIVSLIKVSLNHDMNIFKINSKKQNKFTKFGLPLFFTLSIMFLFGIYANELIKLLKPVHLEFVVLTLFAFFITILTFIEGVYKSGSLLFNCKDDQLLFSLPIKKSTVLFIRIFKLYCFEFLYNSLFLLAPIIIYAYYVQPSWTYYLASLIALILLPIVPIVLFLSKWISYSSIWFLVLSVLFSGAAYICANLLLKNEPAQIIMGSFVAKLKR